MTCNLHLGAMHAVIVAKCCKGWGCALILSLDARNLNHSSMCMQRRTWAVPFRRLLSQCQARLSAETAWCLA